MIDDPLHASARRGVPRCRSKEITRRPFTIALAGFSRSAMPHREVREVEAEPDAQLDPEVPPTAREHRPSDDPLHAAIERGIYTVAGRNLAKM